MLGGSWQGSCDRAVTPVVGIVLVVAVTVLLGALLVLPVMSLAEETSEPQPNTAIETDNNASAVTLGHVGGESIPLDQLALSNGSVTVQAGEYAPTDGEAFTAGTELHVQDDLLAGDRLDVIYQGQRYNHIVYTADIRDLKPPAAGTDDPLLGTAADTEIPVNAYGDVSQAQYEALEAIELTDPFTLAVEAPELAGEDSFRYGVTAFYDAFDEAPNDQLTGPSVPLEFDEDGIATVTIGSAGTDADVTTWIAPGSLSDDATLVNNIEVPPEAERVAVETA